MANVLVKWRPGKSGLYESHTMGRSDWKALGFEDDDTKEVVFSRDNNFTVVGDDLPFAQTDFFENNRDFEVKKNPDADVKMSKKASATAEALGAGEPTVVSVADEGGTPQKEAANMDQGSDPSPSVSPRKTAPSTPGD